jgi:sigma-B regulation protein RsbU (phosphoserine phosphatase)
MSESTPTPAPGSGGAAAPGGRLDLSRIRHELRTPINHILGYTEMLLEEETLPPAFIADLRRIHAGGRQLQTLIGEYFDDEKFFEQRDLHRLYHELRTPVNQIIGYSELLQELAEEQGIQAPIADLQKIHDAAGHWLALMEAYLIESVPTPAESSDSNTPGAQGQSLALNTGLGFQVPEPRSARGAFTDQGSILIVDDDETNRDMLARRLRRYGYTVSAAPSGVQALKLARSQTFDLILLDMIMPGLDGFQVLAKFKADAALREIPVIMLSALDEENGIARCIELGAEDYLSKPFNPVFLWARIGACLERKRLRDRQRAAFEALQKSQQQLAAELAEAAAYVRSLLPAPLTGPIETQWCFHPGAQLGGDAFGYHSVDDNHFAIYLLDVCGHGVGAALLSVSVLNTLRAQTLPGADFRQPATVLAALNRTFQMEKQNQLYFTIWFGVYRRQERELVYASGGHPPALLIGPSGSPAPALTAIRTPSPAIGCLEEASYANAVQPVPPGSRLLVLSDGVFEILRENNQTGTWAEFVASFNSLEVVALRPAERLWRAQQVHGADTLEDDFSLVDVRFH